ncbi:hypothetical protein ACFC53_14495, partial [Enterococcus casseliflavus]|uniref:hypothetical protein n=1 Tax=Enterococcus casseliflavus TaxID=37734 RepID=UPI0035DE4A2B
MIEYGLTVLNLLKGDLVLTDERWFQIRKRRKIEFDMLPLYRTLKYKVAYIGGVCMSRGKMKLSSEERLAFVERALK